MNLKNAVNLIHLESCESTQDEALKLIRNQRKALVVLSEIQNKGRGRRARQWQSHPESSLTFTLAITDIVPKELKNFISLIAGAALYLSLARCSKKFEYLSLKWPNDLGIYKNNLFYKVAGILVEYKEGYYLIGLGINLRNSKAFPQATSLFELDPDVNIDKKKLALSISNHLLEILQEKNLDQLLEFIHNKPMFSLWNKELGKNWEKHIAKGVAGDGSLICIGDKSQLQLVYAGDI